MTERDRRRDEPADDETSVQGAGFMTSATDVFETGEGTAGTLPPQEDEAEFDRQMEIGRRSMQKHRTVLAALAK